MDYDNKYGMRDLHIALLKILFIFNNFCKEKKIVYSLGFGSMLGAIRDKGIIPWDDDIDILVDRENYLKLETSLEKSNELVLDKDNSKTLWVPRLRYKDNARSDPDYELTIDVFIIDKVPENAIIASAKIIMIYALQGMMKKKLNLQKGTMMQKGASLMAFLVGYFVPEKVKSSLFKKVSAIGNACNAKYSACYNAEFMYVRHRYDGRLLLEIIDKDFDGNMIPISKYYHSYLSTLYGDYMTPPKMNDRIPKHLKDIR